MHCRENGLHPGFPFCDLLLELLQLVNDLFQLEPDALRRRAALHQKRPWPFTATDLRYDLLDLLPRRDPFAPDNEGSAAEHDANQDNDEPGHSNFYSLLNTFRSKATAKPFRNLKPFCGSSR